jgi:hypothetical protein
MLTSMRPKDAIYIALTTDRTTWQIQSWRLTISKRLDMVTFSAIMLIPDASKIRSSGVGNLLRYETSEPPRGVYGRTRPILIVKIETGYIIE